MKNNIRIAIDGPAAAGKSTVAKIVAKKLSYIYIDTGAMYRALTYKLLKENADLSNEKSVEAVLKRTEITLEMQGEQQVVKLDQEDVTEKIRKNEVSNSVSLVAQQQYVRQEMVKRQRALSDNQSVVMDGRDIGTHVIPDAEVKIFLIASVEERAQRRYEENQRKGIPSTLSALQKEIEERDYRDMNREISPLTKAADAIELDTTALTINEVSEAILDIVNQKLDS